MIYLIGGAARVGKSILGQQFAAKLGIGWISTDLVMELLRLRKADGIKSRWNAAPEAITANAQWFFPYLERFVWGVSSLADSYVIEGVDFLPAQAMQLSGAYPIRAVFLGCSRMTLETIDRFPGRSPGYAGLPEEARRKIARDVPPWSDFIRQESERCGYVYFDTANDFPQRMAEAEAALTGAV